jgi:hypothetical protein
MARGQADDDEARGAFWCTGWSVFVLWNLGTAAGALAGRAWATPRRSGSTRCSRPPSSRCSRRSCARRARCPRRWPARRSRSCCCRSRRPACPVLVAALGVVAGLIGRR